MSSRKQITLYIDWASQPSRAVAIFLKLNKIPFEVQETRIIEGANRARSYRKINPDAKVPCLVEKNLDTNEEVVIFESHAILRYLCDSRQLPDQYYPKDQNERLKINQYLDWHHTNIRKGGWLVFNTLFAPLIGIKPFLNMDFIRADVERSLELIDSFFLKDKKWVYGRDQLSIADLSCYCEVIQLQYLSYDFSPYENLTAWMEKMNKIKEVYESHEVFRKTLAISLEAQKEAQQEEQKPKL